MKKCTLTLIVVSPLPIDNYFHVSDASKYEVFSKITDFNSCLRNIELYNGYNYSVILVLT